MVDADDYDIDASYFTKRKNEFHRRSNALRCVHTLTVLDLYDIRLRSYDSQL